MRQRELGNPTEKAWIAGWDASITFSPNPYKRAPQARAFDRGKQAGFRQNDTDAAALKRLTSRT